MSQKFPKIRGTYKVTNEMYDIVYNDIMHLWTLLPKYDFWVARQFAEASCAYLHSIHEICKHYEDRENNDSK